ncbi:MAG: hypothetical protein ACR2OZ_01935 [Verrucomicrobiales bacterium]
MMEPPASSRSGDGPPSGRTRAGRTPGRLEDFTPSSRGVPWAGRFQAAARSVTRRLALTYFLAGLRKGIWLVAAAVPVLIILRLSGIRAPEVSIVMVLLAAWALMALNYSWRRWPTPYAALAAWDRAAGRSDLFSSALIFEEELARQGVEVDPGRELHLVRAGNGLADMQASLKQELRLPHSTWTWLAPSLALLMIFVPWLKPQLSAGDSPMTASMLANAKNEAEKLLVSEKRAAEIKELSEDERRRLAELQKSIQETAAKLKDAAEMTPREVLAELEKRAREAEDLAKELGADNTAWASEQMLAEMRKHPDTADLASGIRDRNAGTSGAESRQIANQLENPQLTSEASERIAQALDRTMNKATDDDRKKMVGQHVGAADQHMEKQEAPAASGEFAKLAEKFERQEQRENSQKELQKLAERLRQSGGSIMGQNNQGMKKLAGNQSGAATQPSTMPDMTPLGQLDGARGDSSQLPVPGLGKIPEIKFGKGRGSVIPGTGKLPIDIKSLTLIPGTAGQPEMALPLAAPIPGTAAKAALSAPGLEGGAAAQGGLRAGRGHLPSGNSPSKPKVAGAQGEVAGSINEDGESFVRQIEGQPHEEAALRAAKKTAADFVKVQEEAFDEQALPPSRRQQVRRYFEAIRLRFEE